MKHEYENTRILNDSIFCFAFKYIKHENTSHKLPARSTAEYIFWVSCIRYYPIDS